MSAAVAKSVKLVIERAGHTPFEIDVPEGEALIDACDERAAPVSFSCRSASCGTCAVRVIEGGDRFARPSAAELDVLHDLGLDEASHRLACVAKISTGDGRMIRVAPLNDVIEDKL